jgi:hypothetical protein
MNEDQKVGTLIIVVAATLIAIALVLSKAWGAPGVSLYLFEFSFEFDDSVEHVVVYTRYVLAVFLLIAGYGVARYLSLFPPLFRRSKPIEANTEETSDGNRVV